MIQMIPTTNIRVGDILCEGLVLSVDTSEAGSIIIETPLGFVHATPRGKAPRIGRLSEREVLAYKRAVTKAGTHVR